MNPYLVFFGIGLLALLQVSLMPVLAVRGVAPGLVTVVVVSWALLQRTRSALAWALVGGLWLDALGSGPFGLYTAGLLAAAAAVGQVASVLHITSPLLPLLMVAAGTLIANLVHMALLAVSGHSLPPTDVLAPLVGLEIVINAVLSLPLYPLVAVLSRRVGGERLPLE
ncbi:MAG: rod shape-determining protein MreD [Caldilineales bacterium]|nr:rod shape-determining protein MreD [Caldilineales bacterium]MDW8316981.1 rod shape-determining protein MreD [Anaerolineae bacterium]